MSPSAFCNRSRFVARVSFLMLLASASVFSQANVGRIFGSISDPSTALIPGASVTITDVDRGTSRTVVTDEAGAYNAPSLPPGPYRVRAELPGCNTGQRPHVAVRSDQAVQVD